MASFNRKKHWEKIYETKALNEVSWYQPTPQTSLSFFTDLKISKNARIIDIGGGDSFLVDHLLDLDYTDITVLDISDAAIKRVQNRLGNKAEFVKWIVADVANFEPTEKYDVWHDRAAFHFLKDPSDITHYTRFAGEAIEQNGHLIIGTFSKNGPLKCSGIEIQQYSENELVNNFSKQFIKGTCFTADHPTPFDTLQNFTFCSFKRK